LQENGEEEEEEEGEVLIVDGRRTETTDYECDKTIEDSMSSLYSSNRSGGKLGDS
jgi:hypothetical protein